jgi:hypothetical protein
VVPAICSFVSLHFAQVLTTKLSSAVPAICSFQVSFWSLQNADFAFHFLPFLLTAENKK